jgi:hypothetical protein
MRLLKTIPASKITGRIGTLTFSFFLLTSSLYAQQVEVSARLDSTHIRIGSQTHLTIEVKQPRNLKVHFPVLVDSIAKSIEVVSSEKEDTSSQSGPQIVVNKRYLITSFDSGVHLIPALTLEIADANAKQMAQTQPLSLSVFNPFPSVDPKKGLYDIKEPINTPFLLSELLPYLPYVLLFLLIVGAIVAFVIWRFNRKISIPFLNKEKPVEPPHVIALRELERIKDEKMWQNHQYKRYYSEITDVLRQYLESRFHIPALEQTSDEILASLKPIDAVSQENQNNLSRLLMTADLVKFAKMEPKPDDNEVSMINAIFFVNQTKFEELKTLEEGKKELQTQQEAESK